MCNVPVPISPAAAIHPQAELRTERMALFSAKTNQIGLGLGAKAAKPTVDISRRKNK